MNSIQRGVMVAFLALGALASQAGQYWWAGNGTTLGGSGTWDTSLTRWGASAAGPFNVAWPNGGSDEAVFTNTSGTVTLGATPIKVSSMKFIASGTPTWTFNGGTLDFGSNGSITHPSGNLIVINSAITGSGTLFLTNSVGAWMAGVALYGNNSNLTGKISMKQTGGSWLSLVVTNDLNFGAVPGSYTADALKFEGGGICSYGNPLTIATNRGITLVGYAVFFNGSGHINFNSVITGSAGLRLIGAANCTNYLNNLNTFSSTFDNNAANIAIGIDNALPHGTGKGEFHFYNGGTLNMNGHVATMNGLGITGSAGGFIDNLAAGPATLIVGDGNGGTTAYCSIKSTVGPLSLIKIGTGSQTLSGSCTYTGATTVTGGTLTIAGTNAASSGMTVNNGGTLVVSGFLSNAVPLTVNAGGTLQADLSVNTNGVFNSSSAVTLAGGTLNIKGKNSGKSATALGALTVNPAGSTVSLTPNGGSGTTLTLGNTWTRQVGGTLLVDVSAAGSTVSSSPTLQNGIIGGYAFVKDNTDFGFATVTGGNIVRYTGATLLDATAAANNLNSTVNYYLTNAPALAGPLTTQTVNSIRINQAGLTVGSGKVLVVGSGGIISTNTGICELNGGTLTAGGADLVFYSVGQVRLYSLTIADNGIAHPVGVTLAGPCTYRFWGGACTYSGDTVINQGATVTYNVLPYGNGKGNLLVNAGGGWDFTDGNGVINGLSQSTNNAGGSVTSWGGKTLTLGNNDATASFSGNIYSSLTLIKVGAGTQTLSGVNTYSGGTILSNGVLSVSSTNNMGGANAKVTFAGGTLRISGTDFTSFGATPLTFTGAGGGLDIADAGNTLTVTNNLAAGTVFTKTGAGTLSLTGTQAGTVTTADPSKISFGAGLGFYNLGVTSDGVLSPAGSGVIGTLAMNNNLTLAGKLLADVTASTNDTVTAGGSITLSTGATLELVNPSLLSRSKYYTLMTAGGGAVSGSLTALNLPYRWKVTAVGNKVVLYYANPGTMIGVN